MFMSVDSIAFVRPRRSQTQFFVPSFVLSCDQTPEIAKTKGALEVVCTLTLKSILGLGNTKTLSRKSSVKSVCVFT